MEKERKRKRGGENETVEKDGKSVFELEKCQ